MLLSLILGPLSPLLVALDALCSIALLSFALLWRRRRRTKQLLEACNLPTVLWRPRFLHYNTKLDRNNKLRASSITGILPRMERLKGPFGIYGTVYGISTPVVHVAHPVPARSILQGSCTTGKRRGSISASSGATKSPAYNHFKNFSGNGVFTADGEEWKEKRASVLHCLIKGVSSSESALRLEREANHAADSIIMNLSQLQNEANDTGVDIVNMVPILQRATVGLIYRYITHDTGTSHTVSSAETAKSGLKSASSSSSSLCSLATPTSEASDDALSSKTHLAPPGEICSPNLLQSYLSSVNDIRMIILAQSRSVWFLLPRWVYRLFSSMYKDEEHTMGPIRAFAARACERAQPGSPLAMLRDRPSHCRGQGVKTEIIPQDLMDEAITLLFAGQDTSAATLSWTLHLLSLYPDVQARLSDEIRSVLLEESNDSESGTLSNPTFTKKLVSKMPLLDAVIKESMRLYPVAPFVVRKLQHDVSVTDSKESAVLPSGAFCCIWIYGLHRNPKLWHRPNDFVPNRWLDPALRDVGQDGAYMPYAAGPRSCVGQPLANVILRIVLARLVLAFDFSDERLSQQDDAKKLEKEMQAGFTVLPSDGLKLRVTARSPLRAK